MTKRNTLQSSLVFITRWFCGVEFLSYSQVVNDVSATSRSHVTRASVVGGARLLLRAVFKECACPQVSTFLCLSGRICQKNDDNVVTKWIATMQQHYKYTIKICMFIHAMPMREWLCRTLSLISLIIFNCAMVRRRRRRRRRSSSPKNPPNCARCCWRARVPVQWHLADLRFRFLARQIDLKSWIHVI